MTQNPHPAPDSSGPETPLTCADCQAHLPEYVAASLTPALNQAMTRHLATCRACRNEERGWQLLQHTVQAQTAGALPNGVEEMSVVSSVWAKLETTVQTPAADTLAAQNSTPPVWRPHTHVEIPDETTAPTQRTDTVEYRSNDTMGNRFQRQRSGAASPADTDTPGTAGTTTIAPGRRPHSMGVWLSGLAAALIVASLGAGLYGALQSRARHPGTSAKQQNNQPAAGPSLTINPNITLDPKTGFPSGTVFNSIQMVSADDGWAVGGWGASSGNTSGVVIAHFANGAWTLVADDTSGAVLNSVSLDAANDGWAVGDPAILLHFNGAHWQMSTSPSGLTDKTLKKVQMLSATEGWALGDWGVHNGSPSQTSILLHYLNGKWAVLPTTLSYLQDLSLDSASHGWVVGGSGNSQLAQYTNGSWQNWGQNWAEGFSSVSSLSPTDAWAIGYPTPCACKKAASSAAIAPHARSGQNALATITPVSGTTGNSILHFDGARWSTVPLGLPSADNLGFITMISADEGWAMGLSISSPGGPTYMFALHYQNGVWHLTTLQMQGQLIAASFTSASDGWAVGLDGARNPLLLHYHNGAWSVYHR